MNIETDPALVMFPYAREREARILAALEYINKTNFGYDLTFTENQAPAIAESHMKQQQQLGGKKNVTN